MSKNLFPPNGGNPLSSPDLKSGASRGLLVKVGLIGLGTVGQAVVDLAHHFGNYAFQVERAAVRDASKARRVSIALTEDVGEIIHDPAIDVVVEAVGGREAPREWILQALANHKAVVTANKEVMAYHGPELLHASHVHGAYLGFEASVAGGIPIVDALQFHLTTAPVQEVFGILNGTTNYLLDGLTQGRPYPEVLHAAQRAGYAESDPTADIAGLDTARKLVLLTYLAFGRWIDPDRLTIEGLSEWPEGLFDQLANEHLALKLVGAARRDGGNRITAQVRPTLVPLAHPLYHVAGAQNAIGIRTEAGLFWVEGPGAGGVATATSIWADVRRSQYSRLPMHDAPSDRLAPDPVDLPTREIALDLDPGNERAHSAKVFSDRETAGNRAPVSVPARIFTFPFWGWTE